ncbi:MAG: MmcB family DNA repair protein [Caulobacterales bacterium]
MSETRSDRPETTARVARGVCRVLQAHGWMPVLEAPLANGRRADVLAIGPRGEIWIVETKSGLPDFVADSKWPEYLDYCDCFFFGVDESFPRHVLPPDAGQIVADNFGGEIIHRPVLRALPPARRKALTLMVARLAASRLTKLADG